MSGSELTGRRLAPLTFEECDALLARHYVGRLAFLVDGKPEIMPMNYRWHLGSIVMRTTYGQLLDALLTEREVAFEIDEVDPDYHSGWSVVVHGRAVDVWEPEEIEALRELPLRPWAPGDREHYVRIDPASITGRRLS